MAGKINIGIHLRGTDRTIRLDIDAMMKAMLDEAERAAGNREVQYYIATDDQWLLNMAKGRLKGNVIYCESRRSNDGAPLHVTQKRTAEAPILAEETLIEGLLLSKCNFMVHTHSSFPVGVLVMNPYLESVYLDPFPWIQFHRPFNR